MIANKYRGPGHYDIIYKPEDLVENEAVVMRASESSFNINNHWSQLDQIQPRLQDNMFQKDGESHGGTELIDSCWNIPGATLLDSSVAGGSGSFYLPHGFRTCYEPFKDEAEDTIFADPLDFSIVPCNESRAQDAGQLQILSREFEDARLGFPLNTLPMADLQSGESEQSALPERPQNNLHMGVTLHAPSPASVSADEPLGTSICNASGAELTSQSSMVQQTFTSGTQFEFRMSSQQLVHEPQLSLDPLASPNTSKKPMK